MLLLNQIIIAIITWVILGVSRYFFNIVKEEDKKNTSERDGKKIQKYTILEIIFFVFALAGAGYFLIYLITTTPFNFWNTVFACVKAMIFIVIAVEILILTSEDFDDIDLHMNFNLSAIVVVCLIIIFGSWINYEVQENKYEKNITIIEEIQYSKEEYKLLKEFNVTDLEENDIVTNSISEYFNYNAVRYSSSYVARTYDIYYLIDKDGNSEKIYKTLDGRDTKLVSTEEGEEPYLEIKTHTQYGIDNNQDPPVEIVIEEKIEYVLHVPQKDIKKVLEIKV